MTLTKRDIVLRISSETGLLQQDVMKVVQHTLDQITGALAAGDKVELRQFGVFDIAVRKPRIGRNPKKPEKDVAIPLRVVVKFKAGKEMKACVSKLSVKKTQAQLSTRKRAPKPAPKKTGKKAA